MYFRRSLMAAAAAASLLAFSPALADVKAGVDAWQAGNFAAAITAWRPLAEKGDADAQFNMGQAYKLGRGVPSDLKLAQSWYEKAAQQGHEQAQANLGLILFQNGEREKAIPWIRKAADNGDPRAQYVLGTALFNGDVVPKDWPRAYALMTRAAAQGLPQATTSLTEMDNYIPPADRQKGVAMAKVMAGAETPVAVTASGAARPAPAARVASKTLAPKPTPPAKALPATLVPKTGEAALKPKPAPKPAATSLASAGGKWRVQLGAYGSPAGARTQWAALSKKIGGLGGLQPSYEAAGALTRLRAGPLGSRAAADQVCSSAKAAGQPCFPVAP
jgi:cell division septation protein DedD